MVRLAAEQGVSLLAAPKIAKGAPLAAPLLVCHSALTTGVTNSSA